MHVLRRSTQEGEAGMANFMLLVMIGRVKKSVKLRKFCLFWDLKKKEREPFLILFYLLS